MSNPMTSNPIDALKMLGYVRMVYGWHRDDGFVGYRVENKQVIEALDAIAVMGEENAKLKIGIARLQAENDVLLEGCDE